MRRLQNMYLTQLLICGSRFSSLDDGVTNSCGGSRISVRGDISPMKRVFSLATTTIRALCCKGLCSVYMLGVMVDFLNEKNADGND